MTTISRDSYPLHWACATNDEVTARNILENSAAASEAVYSEDSAHSWVPMHWAAHYGSISCMQALHDYGTSTGYVSERLHQSALHVAADSARSTVVSWLLAAHTTPVNCKDYLGETALHKAARRGDTTSLDLLYQHGADFSLHNNTGLTAADLAGQCGHDDIAVRLRAVKGNDTPVTPAAAPPTMEVALPSNRVNHRKRSYTATVVDNCSGTAKRFRDNIQDKRQHCSTYLPQPCRVFF